MPLTATDAPACHTHPEYWPAPNKGTQRLVKKVSAATITQLSAAAACNAAVGASPAPSVEDLLVRLREADPIRAQEFETLLAKLPQGFALTPVLYTRIAQAQGAALESEYVFSVRQRFLKFLAQTQKKALRDLGICDHGIARMARGLDPANVRGERYAVSVDHIIERGGSGTMAQARAKDELRDDTLAETFPPNHFANLLLLPQDVHDYKNRLNGLQDIHKLSAGESCWILMLTPVTTAQNHGYVCAPQPANTTLGQLALHVPNLHQQIGETKTIAVDTIEAMQALVNDTSAGSIIAMLDQLAGKNRPAHARRTLHDDFRDQRKADIAYLGSGCTVADLGVAQPRGSHAANNNNRHGAGTQNTVPSAPNTLRAIFNAAASHDRDVQRVVESKLRPQLRELADLLEKAHARAVTYEIRTPGHRNYSDFVQFFRGRNVRALCVEASYYPLAESRELLNVYRRINRDITQRSRAPKQIKSLKKSG